MGQQGLVQTVDLLKIVLQSFEILICASYLKIREYRMQRLGRNVPARPFKEMRHVLNRLGISRLNSLAEFLPLALKILDEDIQELKKKFLVSLDPVHEFVKVQYCLAH